MPRLLGILAALAAVAALSGCKTTELKGQSEVGLINDVSSGTKELGYGDGKGDSIGLPGGADEKSNNTGTREEGH